MKAEAGDLVSVTRIWWVPAATVLVVVFRPLPLILTFPAALALTVTSSAFPLTLTLATLTVGFAGRAAGDRDLGVLPTLRVALPWRSAAHGCRSLLAF
jgi:hypothetical protein